MAITTEVVPEEKISYPETDSKPMAETDIHRDLMMDLIESLKDYFRNEPLVYVSGNTLLVYFQQGNPKVCVAPDVFVVRGIPKKRRRIYKVWQEKKTPDFVLELTSRSTASEDLDKKWIIYQNQLKVEEYFLFDPLGEYLNPSLLGYRLAEEKYSEILPSNGRLKSKVLGLELGVKKGQLRLFEPDTGEMLLNPLEQAEARRQAEKRASQAEKRIQYEAGMRKKLEEEVKRLKAELDALRS